MKMLIVVAVLSLSLPVFAATHAVRPDCPSNGDGSSWECGSGPGYAYNTLPNILVRGDTYYVSKGTLILSYYPLDDPAVENLWINFKKATDAEHGAEKGWSAVLGDGQTIFSSSPSDTDHNGIFNMNNNAACKYYKFDGVYGAGPSPEAYGFKFIPGRLPPLKLMALFYGFDAVNDNIELHHCAFVGPYPDRSNCAWAIANGGRNWIINSCLFKGFDNAIHGFSLDLMVNKTWFTDIWGGGAQSCHGQQISYNQDRLTVKNSVFIDNGVAEGKTAFISFNDARNPGYGADGWRIYNNIFVGCTAGGGILTNSSSGGSAITNMVFYNNTIVGGDGKIYDVSGINNVIKNNLYYNANIALDAYSNLIHDYNYWDFTCTNKPTTEKNGKTEIVNKYDLFIDPDNYDFHIKKSNSVARKNGIYLGQPVHIDRDGLSRPKSSGWDMGAYQSDGILIKIPTNLRTNE